MCSSMAFIPAFTANLADFAKSSTTSPMSSRVISRGTSQSSWKLIGLGAMVSHPPSLAGNILPPSQGLVWEALRPAWAS